jgi:hypothetical protein
MYNCCFALYIKINFLILVLTDQFKGAQALECLAFVAFLVTVVVIVYNGRIKLISKNAMSQIRFYPRISRIMQALYQLR